MLKIDLDYARFVYKVVLMATIDQLWDEFNHLGLSGFGYPEGSGFTYFGNE